jgi:hypothetical protein
VKINQQKWNNDLSAAGLGIAAPIVFPGVIFGQRRLARLEFLKSFMSSSRFVWIAVLCLGFAFILTSPMVAEGQTNYYAANGTEYPVVGSLPGDQMFPDVALNANGGYLVWQDNITDGSGWGISAQRLDNTLSGALGSFRVNVQGTNDQQNARVAMLKNGGAVFVWQGGLQGAQHIYARFLTASNTWLSANDVAVNTFSNSFQVNPAVTVLNDSNVVVTWSSYDQAGPNTLLDIYAKILSPAGATVKSEFLVNQFTNYNQRSASVAALNNGGFVVAWVSEQEQLPAPNLGANSSSYYTANATVLPSVDIYVRLFQSNGVAFGNEFLVDSNSIPTANPAVAAATDGSFMVAWSGRDLINHLNGWDVYARSFSPNGAGGNILLVNTYVAGNQYAPHLCAIGLDYLVVWTSLDQDGSREGVYGQYVHSGGFPVGSEFRVNTTTISQQMQPAVASDGSSQFLATWTSFTGSQSGQYGFDLYAQRYANVDSILQTMPAPFVFAPFTLSNNVYQPQLQVSWAPLSGISVSNYEVYLDGASTPVVTTATNAWMMTAANGLATNSTHAFAVDYVKANGMRSPLSAATSATTWSGLNWGGVPFEWMELYYGTDISQWPSAKTPLASGGLTLLQIFTSGGNPLNPATWLTTQLSNTAQGVFLTWNTQPGFTYQVIYTTNFVTWNNYGSPRFAAGTSDSVYVGGSANGYYRVVLLR